MATVTVTITCKDEDNIPVEYAKVTVIDNTGAVVKVGVTDNTGVYSGTISTSEATPNVWRVVAKKPGHYYKAGGLLIWSDATTASQRFVMDEDNG